MKTDPTPDKNIPEISIVVPVYNVEKYLDKCIESILRQTFEDFELILVDDGSPDNSGKICDEWAKKDSRIKVIHQKNGGLPNARNTGINNATGRYIAFVDSDDWVEKDFLSVLYSGITENNADIVQCNYSRVFDSGREDFIQYKNEIWDRQHIEKVIMPQLANYIPVNMSNSRWNKIYRSDIARKAIEYGDEKIVMGEDFLMNIAAVALSEKVVILDTPPMYKYRYNINSISTGYNKERKYNEKYFYKNISDIATHFGYKSDKIHRSENWRYGYYIFECAISDLSRREKKREINDILALIDKKIWYKEIKNYRTFAEKLCMYMVYFHLTGLMLILADIRKKAGTKVK